jgi:hypothetical protein
MTLIHHAVRHVRAAACRTTNKFGSPNQQQEIKNIVNKKQQWHNTILGYDTMKHLGQGSQNLHYLPFDMRRA